MKILDIDWFENNLSKSWIIDNNWSDDEKINLGIKREEITMNEEELCDFIDSIMQNLKIYKTVLKNE